MVLHLGELPSRAGPAHHAVVVTHGAPSFSGETGSIWVVVYPNHTVPITDRMVSSEIHQL